VNLIHTIHEPTGAGPHPALLTLHGRGANALDLLGLAPHLCGGKFLMISPQAPLETPVGPGMTGFAWYSLSMGGPPDIDAMVSSREKLEIFLDQCLARYPIDQKRIALLGFSQGGVMAYSLALTNPRRFAGMAALSTWLPRELVPRLNISGDVHTLQALVQHGTEDPTIEIARARDSVERLRELKLPLTYREYEMGHEITPRSLGDLSAWLEEKVLAGSES
jgi:phospholipase/carboxylesterase